MAMLFCLLYTGINCTYQLHYNHVHGCMHGRHCCTSRQRVNFVDMQVLRPAHGLTQDPLDVFMACHMAFRCAALCACMHVLHMACMPVYLSSCLSASHSVISNMPLVVVLLGGVWSRSHYEATMVLTMVECCGATLMQQVPLRSVLVRSHAAGH